MKFTNGFWLMREEYEPTFAVEYAGHEVEGESLVVYGVAKHITDRGDCLNIGMLTVTFTSPMEDVIHTEVTHFDGKAGKSVRPVIYPAERTVAVTEDESTLTYQSGTAKAVIAKAPGSWCVAYYRNDSFLTMSDYRNMARMLNKKTGESYMVEQLSLDTGEYVYGLGERFTAFVKNGQIVENWNEDGGTASEQGYKCIPFYLSNKGYGILVDTLGEVSFEIGSEKVEEVQFSVPGETLGYYVIAGEDPKGAVSRYCELTGKPALPPAWSFGLWLTTSFTTNYDEETTSSFIQGMEDREIPLHVFHFDCYWMRAYRWCDFIWDPDTFSDPEGMLKRYHDRGLKICVWINPYIGQMSCLFKEGKENGYLLKKTDGSVWQTDLWQPGMALVDFTNPDAVAWYQSKLKALLDMGVDCFKTDFGERVPVTDIQWFDGSDPVDMHNAYTYLYNQAVFTLLEQEKQKGNAVLFARSATVGGQQFPAHWGGDCSATYSSMAETLRGGLSLACGGFGFWSHDISGFEQTASPDIYKRWCQFGLMSSHSRLHGSSSYRVPWLFDDEASVVLKEMVELKCRLMPYLYQMAVVSAETGVPMMRPMFMEYPKDRTCLPLDMQYMMGDSLLVAPVFRENGEVEYYLPQGRWYNLMTGELREGGRWHTDTFDYHAMPLMVAPGRILAVGSISTKPDYDYAAGVTLGVSWLADGESTQVTIPDISGKPVMTAEAVRCGQKITVTVQGGDGTWKTKALWDPDAVISRDDNQAVITLSEGK
ncbi:MAG: alpha-xylosidase [Blautia sp.]|nr:alpha-xylosidase [Blautia sp.]MDY5031589.1 alpha-xylosidase [Blautia sp.]